jgi:hypothetical protein
MIALAWFIAVPVIAQEVEPEAGNSIEMTVSVVLNAILAVVGAFFGFNLNTLSTKLGVANTKIEDVKALVSELNMAITDNKITADEIKGIVSSVRRVLS